MSLNAHFHNFDHRPRPDLDVKAYYDNSGVTLLHGDCREVLRSLPEKSVHCCITSPPYWGLRDYGISKTVWADEPTCEHQWGDSITVNATNHTDKRRWNHTRNGRGEEQPAKKQVAWLRTVVDQGNICQRCGAWRGALGLEPTPELYVEHLVAVFREVRRVLRDDGTLWLNLGDCYASQGGPEPAQTKWQVAGASDTQNAKKSRSVSSNLKPKDLVGIPWRCAFALQADGWWLRSDIIWAKPAPMPESVTDRPTRSHEYIFLLAKAEQYYCDMEAIKEPAVCEHPSGNGYKRDARLTYSDDSGARGSDKPWTPRSARDSFKRQNSKRATVHPGQTVGTHRPDRAESEWDTSLKNKRDVWTVNAGGFPEAHFATFPPSLILPCVLAGCPTGGVIIDPFSGAATTALVAKENGRRAIGIELNEEYLAISKRRLSQEVFDFV